MLLVLSGEECAPDLLCPRFLDIVGLDSQAISGLFWNLKPLLVLFPSPPYALGLGP